MAPAYYEKDEGIRKRNHEQIKKDVVPFFLEKLDKIAEENNGHLALGKVKNDRSIGVNFVYAIFISS